MIRSSVALALALEQRIGGDRRAHLDGADRGRGDRLARAQTQQVANALHGGVAIGFRVVRQQLVGDERAVWGRPTTSVNVPPRSIQKSQVSFGDAPAISSPSPPPSLVGRHAVAHLLRP